MDMLKLVETIINMAKEMKQDDTGMFAERWGPCIERALILQNCKNKEKGSTKNNLAI